MTLTRFPNGIAVGGVEIRPQLQVATKSGSFAGGTTNARGNFGGTGNPAPLFVVTGEVLVIVFGYCTADLVGATATLEVGVAGNTAGIIAQTTATAIDVGMVWRDATPALGVETLNDALVIVGGADILERVGTANITAGAITYYCLWMALSADGAVVAA